MTSEPITTALERQAEKPEAKSVRDLIEGMKPELEKSLRSGEAADMLIRHYYSAVRFNPLLLQSTADSMVAALLLSAQVGLEPGPLGHVYLVPFYNTKLKVPEVVWVLGYTGILALGRDGGAIGLVSEIVWDCDEYEPPWRDERGVHFKHRPAPIVERQERVAVLASWKERVGSAWVASAYECPPSRIERARKASPAARSNSGPWITDEDAMWRKTGVRYVRPWLPLTPQFALAARSDDSITHYVEPIEDGSAQPVLEAPEE